MITLCYHLKMNIDQLYVFITIVQTGSYRAASKHLHRSQPALTKTIQNLETQCGFALFNKSAYRATLTAEGAALYEKAKTILQQMRHFSQYANAIASGYETEVHISIDKLYSINRISDVLISLINNYPHTAFNFYSDALGGGMDRLQNNKADLIISENLGHYQNVDAKLLVTYDMVPVANPIYFEANKEAFENVDLLQQNRQIILRDTSEQFPAYNFGVVEGTQHWSVDDLEMKKQLICTGVGWGRTPLPTVQDEIDRGELMILDYPHIPTKQVPLSLIRRNDRKHGTILAALWEQIPEHIGVTSTIK